MSLIPQPALPDSFPPYEAFRQHFGFVPAIFRAQSLLPRIIEAEAQIAGAVLLAPGALTRIQKETILLTLASRHRNVYCVTAHRHFLQELGVPTRRLDVLARDYHDAGLSPTDAALLDFALKLGGESASFHHGDIEALRANGLTDEQILEAVLMTALTNFLCTLSAGLDVVPDFESSSIRSSVRRQSGSVASAPPGPPTLQPRWGGAAGTKGPYLRAVVRDPQEFPPFAFFQKKFGFIPNIFRAQTLRPDVVEAEAFTVGTVLLTDDVLSRVRKEFILLVISAANLNTYCVAVHCEMLRGLGLPEEVSDQIAVDHHMADLSQADKALLDAALKVARRSTAWGLADVERLRIHGFTDHQILEAVVMASLTNFLNTLQVGLGTVPDFHPRRVFAADVNLLERPAHPTLQETGGDEPTSDPDTDLVAGATRGDRAAFEALVRGHHRRLYRILLCITGNTEDAEDATQTAFLKAFQHLGDFEGRARFGTWLTRIAINEGLECVRTRRPMESLSHDDEDGEYFRPRLVLTWADDPERLYQREEQRALVERAVASLPMRYRMAVLLRDLEQLSTAEAAVALGLGIPTLKTHLLRGRLLLREALAPHFIHRSSGVAGV
jgi:RNA polymerase sigma-70 factor (ECF subfamily)